MRRIIAITVILAAFLPTLAVADGLSTLKPRKFAQATYQQNLPACPYGQVQQTCICYMGGASTQICRPPQICQSGAGCR
jgi:hypothetical protein